MSFGLVQAINDPTEQANIHASDVTNKFMSEINPSSYYNDYNSDRNYYLIGSSLNAIVPGKSKIGSLQTEPDRNASVVNTYYNTYNIYNGTELQRSSSNQTDPNIIALNGDVKNKTAIKRDSKSAAPTNDIRSDLGITKQGKKITSIGNTNKEPRKSVIDDSDEDKISDVRKNTKTF
jgi:predicted polyphosphate/ATP-dependent NAD kinase